MPELQLKVASPCSVSWDAMAGDEKVRFCALCQKCVYNLSAMSLREARTLVQEREGNVCVRFYERPDGTVMTSDCGFGVARAVGQARRFAGKMLGAAIGLLGLTGAGAALFGDNLRRMFLPSATMGALSADMIPVPPQPPPKHRNVVGMAAFATES